MPCAGRPLRSWPGSVVIDECRHRPEIGDAARVERFRVERLDEARGQTRQTAATEHAVTLSFGDEQASVRKTFQDRLAITRRSHRIPFAFDDENGFVALDRLVKIGRPRAVRPDLALR